MNDKKPNVLVNIRNKHINSSIQYKENIQKDLPPDPWWTIEPNHTIYTSTDVLLLLTECWTNALFFSFCLCGQIADSVLSMAYVQMKGT